ncbi:TrpR like protein [mine drainage metagenome]|uniref:TrpR like protein n=1 Tax=mine drainage metagenome TaxID=410659 RepID=T1BI10_9ZZZZ
MAGITNILQPFLLTRYHVSKMKQKQPGSLGTDASEDPAKELFQAIADLRTAAEAAGFMGDLCTPQELQAMGARWQVVRLLDQGMHYQAIAERTGASTATISRVSNWLRFGTGGYRAMLERWHEAGR